MRDVTSHELARRLLALPDLPVYTGRTLLCPLGGGPAVVHAERHDPADPEVYRRDGAYPGTTPVVCLGGGDDE